MFVAGLKEIIINAATVINERTISLVPNIPLLVSIMSFKAKIPCKLIIKRIIKMLNLFIGLNIVYETYFYL